MQLQPMIDNETESGLRWPVLLFHTSRASVLHAVFDLRTAGETHIGLACEISILKDFNSFYAPPPESGGVLCYTLRNFECPSIRLSVCLSVRPSVRPSVRQRPPPFLYRQLLLQF